MLWIYVPYGGVSDSHNTYLCDIVEKNVATIGGDNRNTQNKVITKDAAYHDNINKYKQVVMH